MQPEFPKVDPERLAAAIFAIPRVGRPASYKSRLSCTVCQRQVVSPAWLITVGHPSCADEACALWRPGDISKHFVGAYGPALNRSQMLLLSRTHALQTGAVLVERKMLYDHVVPLCRAFERLVKWQRVYDAWEFAQDPEGYAEGKIRLVPPRKVMDVAVLRMSGLLERDPVVGLEASTRLMLKRVYHEGVQVLKVPF